MKQKILLLIILCVQLFSLFQWAAHNTFTDQFHYSSFDLNLRLTEEIHNDHLTPLWQVRIFHNKLLGSITDLFRIYLQFWNPSFITNTTSIAGLFGVALTFFTYCSHQKKTLPTILLIYLLTAPFLEIFQIPQLPPPARTIMIIPPLILWSLLGYHKILQKPNKKIYLLLIAIIFLSLWYQISLFHA